jgi:hypothetical protein
MTIVFFYTLFLTIQCSVLSLIVEWNNPSAWNLKPGIEMLAIVYAVRNKNTFTCIHAISPNF